LGIFEKFLKDFICGTNNQYKKEKETICGLKNGNTNEKQTTVNCLGTVQSLIECQN